MSSGFNRRHFLKTAAVTSGISLLKPEKTAGAASGNYFSVHPDVESKPEAVFIMKTSVDNKLDSAGKIQAGREFGSTVFVRSETAGVPLTHKIAVKANCIMGKPEDTYPEDYLMGAHTDPWFLEGVVEGMKGAGLKGNQFYFRDASNGMKTYEENGYATMAQKVGANISGNSNVNSNPDDVHWVDVPEGIIHRRIPYLLPFNAPDTFLLNIAKFKSHAMGLTLCCKNIQGMICHPYQGFCGGFNGVLGRCGKEHVNPKYKKVVETNFKRHLADGVPRWDKPGRHYDCGLGMETWATRTLDNLSVSPMGLCVVEGIYGRDGSHVIGPHPPFANNNKTRGRTHDYMSNIIIFGKNPIHVDIIGHWLGGHGPGNFGLFHLARERGYSTLLDPKSIPLYRWENGTAKKAQLESFERTPLLTYYLRRNYNGRNEEAYHLCDEPYDYSG